MYPARSSAAKRGCHTQKMYLESTTIPNAFSGYEARDTFLSFLPMNKNLPNNALITPSPQSDLLTVLIAVLTFLSFAP